MALAILSSSWIQPLHAIHASKSSSHFRASSLGSPENTLIFTPGRLDLPIERLKACDMSSNNFLRSSILRNDTVNWRCSVRSKTNRYPATVIQKGESFQTGRHQHNHNLNPGAITNLKIVYQAKTAAITNVFRCSLGIVKIIKTLRHLLAVDLTFIISKESPTDSAKKRDLQNLKILILRYNNFVRKDVRVGSKRHIILATDQQLDLLSSSKIWYMDRTFKKVRKPFVQLFSIHVFLKSGDDTKQVPIAFCMMSSRTKRD
ncbi:hypothetical protein KUTeg_013947 [Tegillarca granosa]|uniref:Uncharacterized protein n=1 Tax=Tegillarca granosa TaxID=220873 RepID=A0ABQ9F0L5_TEGGR|nr:hypothetical protein KUTeg_013947 [Tegillarca granosa]